MVAPSVTDQRPDAAAALPASAPFDAVADEYDAWGATALGRLLRTEMWRRLDASFSVGDRVLELGCGTGSDAVHLAGRGVSVVATDVSAGMLAVAARNIARSAADDLVRVALLDMADVGEERWERRLPDGSVPFDGVFSDFGALNCLSDRRRLAAGLAGVVRPGGHLVLTVMGPLCAWEVAWHLAHGEPRTAARRFRSGGVARVGGRRLRVWYPSPRRLRAEFDPWFESRSVAPVAVALPPTGLAGIVERRPRMLRALATAERQVTRVPASAWLADHYVAVFERRAA